MDFFPVVFIFVIFFGPNERLIIIFRHSFSLAAFVVVAAEVEILLCCVMIKATCTNSICWLSDYFSFRPNTKKTRTSHSQVSYASMFAFAKLLNIL